MANSSSSETGKISGTCSKYYPFHFSVFADNKLSVIDNLLLEETRTRRNQESDILFATDHGNTSVVIFSQIIEVAIRL